MMFNALRSAARLAQRPILSFNPSPSLISTRTCAFIPRSASICPTCITIRYSSSYPVPPFRSITRSLSSSTPSGDVGSLNSKFDSDNNSNALPAPRNAKELPPLDEGDLEESFVKGSGPGGQKINKTSSCVILRHVPSGIVVKCQEHRSQHKNRQYARVLLQKKLDEIERGKESLIAKEAQRARARKARRRRKSVKKHFKSRSDRKMVDDY